MVKRLIPVVFALLATALFRPAGSSGPPNVILLTVDTLRADRLGCFGYKHPTSPNIDGLVKKGTLFLDATSNVPLTSPSFCSMMTGLYPHETGSIRNGIPMVDGIPTLAVMFKEHGYHTTAIISNWPLKRHLSNLQAGFDIYDDDFHEKRWLFFNAERDAEGVSERALKWLDSGPREPFFAWIHYSDPHAPYLKHSEFMFEKSNTDSARYDSEVGYTDNQIGRVLKKIEAMGLFSRSLVVFASDHGESLGEHNYTGHGRRVYQPGLHVPFALVGPGVPAGRRETALIQLLDLAPTVLSFAGIEARKEMTGADLMPFVRVRGGYPQRIIYYETYPGAAPQMEGAEKMLKKPIWVGFRQGSEKLMYSVRYLQWEKYDLEKDPGELEDLVDVRDPAFIEESDRLMAWYREWEDDTVVGEIEVMTAEDREKFKALGYIDTP